MSGSSVVGRGTDSSMDQQLPSMLCECFRVMVRLNPDSSWQQKRGNTKERCIDCRAVTCFGLITRAGHTKSSQRRRERRGCEEKNKISRTQITARFNKLSDQAILPSTPLTGLNPAIMQTHDEIEKFAGQRILAMDPRSERPSRVCPACSS